MVMASRFIIRTIRKADLAAVRDIVTKEFVDREPAGKYLRFTEPEFYKLYDRFAPNIDFNTSIVAETVHEDKRRSCELVSCHINIPLTSAVDLEGLAEPVPLMRVFDKLHEPLGNVLTRTSISEKRVLHSLMGATKGEYQGKGIYKKMMMLFSQQVMKDLRWDAAVAECTSPITRHVMTAYYGWSEENFIRYGEFEIDGQRPFEGLEGGVSLVWKDYKRMRGYL